MLKKLFVFFFCMIFMISLVSAGFSYNNLNNPSLITNVINYTQVNVNSSGFWDNLDDPSDIFGSLINNDLSWINLSLANSLYYSLTNPSNYWNDSTPEFSSIGFNDSIGRAHV